MRLKVGEAVGQVPRLHISMDDESVPIARGGMAKVGLCSVH